MKPVAVLFYADIAPEERQRPKYIIQSLLNQKIGRNNPVEYRVIGTVPQSLVDEIERHDV